MKLIIIKPRCEEENGALRLDEILQKSLDGVLSAQGKTDPWTECIVTAGELEQSFAAPGQLQGQRILFAVSLGEWGINLELYAMLRCIRRNPRCMEHSIAGLLVDGGCELYTKSVAAELVFTANLSGCLFIGQPLVEATESLRNFRVRASNLCLDLRTAYQGSARQMVKRLLDFQPPETKEPRILCLHAGNYETSNTLSLWRLVQNRLEGACRIREIALGNGKIYDCMGCPYQTCLHYGQRSKCFYGGTIVEEVYPAIEQCDVLLMLCPNYNDALGANLTAFINRLTALFRKRQFYDKYLFSIIVSGYSGGDILARQLISSLNMNKTFILPGSFALIETANDPGSILKLEGIEERAEEFAEKILGNVDKSDKNSAKILIKHL